MITLIPQFTIIKNGTNAIAQNEQMNVARSQMKILYTSSWHLDPSHYGRKRSGFFSALLDWLEGEL
ncbi:MAG: hypothetical protein RBQ87_01375 [Candidatus Cloacimonadaceae bacterium]|jgi:hypothetical protein|nr:hypothetical protein [Candidatus Cloacimonadaceae bacterium]